jgi:DNA-binding response OmpR family regulator
MARVLICSPHALFADALSQAVSSELRVECEKHYAEETTVKAGNTVLAVNFPVRLADMLVQIQEALKQSETFTTPFALGDWEVSTLHKTLTHLPSQKNAPLTDKEIDILQLLAGSAGDVVEKEYLLKTVWGFDSALDTHTLETHIYRLRNKFRELADVEVIAASEGGYKWIEP